MYPELLIFYERPARMTDESYSRIAQKDAYDLNAPPTGMPAAIVADRDHD